MKKQEPLITIPKSEYEELIKLKNDFDNGKSIYWEYTSTDMFHTFERITLLGESEAIVKLSIIASNLQKEVYELKNRSFFKRLFNYV